MDHAPGRLLRTALAVALVVAVAGCGGESDKPADEGETAMSATPAAEATGELPADAEVIEITITGDSVTPSGDEVSVKRNQPIVLQIDAAAEGELHVHSSPEHAIEYPEGKSVVQIEIDQPGVVDVEDHGLDKLVVQLEVR
jgi:hypothetical protein